MNTDRDWADKAWLKKPESTPFFVMLIDLAVAAVIVASVIAIVAIALVATARANDSAVDWKVFLPLFARHRDPVNPPRCLKWNVAGERLERSIATQADGGEWVLDCRYDDHGPRA